ncbi:MAG TPA: hypothetical protein VEG33_14325, partial [Streptosporangiaceae bacterium]|nr:hypothetical protein [Streptosporangiaceae bacterium]
DQRSSTAADPPVGNTGAPRPSMTDFFQMRRVVHQVACRARNLAQTPVDAGADIARRSTTARNSDNPDGPHRA